MSGEREFRRVRQHGVALRDPLLTLRVTEYRPRYGEAWRPRAIIGIVVSKKTLRRAVDRNRARRRVREALRTLPGGLPPCRAILLPNPGVLAVPFAELQATLARLMAQVPGRVKRGKGGAKGSNAKGGGGNAERPAPVSPSVPLSDPRAPTEERP
ncbi:ribonuclease P protein component [Deinococcus hopiensis]|uniref:ribonuclease P protein component n=1 Tax=Deinococcus hopiensis TaxID=309885 RepID=UPI000A018362|nr:ribonuclease P protein component [Deinococcus hopiensis]